MNRTVAFRLYGNSHTFAIDIRHYFERLDMPRRHRLQPNRLPDSGHRGVKNSMRLQHLLAARLVTSVGRIPDSNDQIIALVSKCFRYIDREWIVTARMLTNLL